MKFKKLDTLEGIDIVALRASLTEALAEYGTLAEIDDADLTDEQLSDMLVLSDAVEELNVAIAAAEAATTERTEKAKAAREKLAAAKAAATPEDEKVEGAEGADDEKVEGADAENLDAELEALVEGELEGAGAVTASAARTRGVTSGLAGNKGTQKRQPPAIKELPPIIASGGYGGFQAGQKLEDQKELAKAFLARLKGMPSSPGKEKRLDKFSVASIGKTSKFRIDTTKDSSEKIYETLMAARNEHERFGSGGITAAGGWGSPSQIVYDMCVLETVTGILDMPEVTADHGGINFTKGPDFSAIFGSNSWLQTEAQAIAGTTKTFADLIVPSFTDVRLDVIGYGVRTPILTKAAWPELVNRFLQGTLVAHAHRVNASKIARIVTALGTAVVAAHLGSAIADSLTGLEMQAQRLRSKYLLDPNATIEGFAPTWLISVLRQDLAFRNGVDSFLAVTQAQVDSWLAARNIKLQYVYDWQQLAATGVAWPTTCNVALYTPGAFVALTSDVIDLDAVYDTTATGLPQNSFLGAFYEEGLAVYNPCGSGVLVTLDTTHFAGRVGAADITIA